MKVSRRFSNGWLVTEIKGQGFSVVVHKQPYIFTHIDFYKNDRMMKITSYSVRKGFIALRERLKTCALYK